MTQRLAQVSMVLSAATLATLIVILALARGQGPIFETATDVLPWCLVGSSALLGYSFLRAGRRAPAALFALNVALVLGGLVWLFTTKRPLNQTMLFAADVLWLIEYGAILAFGVPRIRRTPNLRT